MAEDLMDKMQAKLDSLGAEFRVEIGTLKERNSTLAAKVEALEAHNAELQTKQTVAELETKLAKKRIDELELALISKIEEANFHLQNEFNDVAQENQQQFTKQIAEKEKKVKAELDRMGERLEDILIEMRGKMADFENQIAAIQNKWEEFAARLAQLEVKEYESQREMDLWKNNRWDSVGHVLCADNKGFCTNVRAKLPISRTLLAVPGRLVYYEVLVKVDPDIKYFFGIGWTFPDFPLMRCCVGKYCSFAINHSGEFWNSGSIAGRGAVGFKSGDMVGTGLMFTQDGRLKVFFTKNGRLHGQANVMDNDKLLYPAVSFYPKNQASVKANFGADLGKPFKFDLDAHRTMLFN